jgi:hypothetical protein
MRRTGSGELEGDGGAGRGGELSVIVGVDAIGKDESGLKGIGTGMMFSDTVLVGGTGKRVRSREGREGGKVAVGAKTRPRVHDATVSGVAGKENSETSLKR